MFEFKPITAEELMPAVSRAFSLAAEELGVKIRVEKGVVEHIARGCGGDVRKSINTAELCLLSAASGGGDVIIKKKPPRL